MTKSKPYKVQVKLNQGVFMKKLLFIFSVLALVSYGCNRGGEQSSGGGTGMQQEQQSQDTGVGSGSPDSSMGSESSDQSGSQMNQDDSSMNRDSSTQQ